MKTNAILTIPRTTIRLGDKVRCVVTRFEGVVTIHARHLTGCDRLWIEGPTVVSDDGKVSTPATWVDVAAVELLTQNVVNAEPMPVEAPSAG